MRFLVPTAGQLSPAVCDDARHRLRLPGTLSRTWLAQSEACKSPSRPPIPGGRGRAYAISLPSARLGTEGLASSQGEVHLHLRLNFDRLAIQEVRFVLPLLHGLNRRRCQHRMPTDQLKVLDRPFLADHALAKSPCPEYGPGEPAADKLAVPCGPAYRCSRQAIPARAAG